MENNRSLEGISEKPPELNDLEREAIEKIGNQFQGLVSTEKLEKMRALPSEFKSHEELAKDYAKETGKTASAGLEGFSEHLEKPAEICSDHRDTIKETILHERLHQASDPVGSATFGDSLSEGVTQALTEKTQGEVSTGNFYTSETLLAKEKLFEKYGDSAVEKLYFQNDTKELASAMAKDAHHDSQLEQFKKNYG